MPKHVEKLAVLFADICGSTALYEKLGDDLARQMIASCLKTIGDKVPLYEGKITKTLGDEVMAIFPCAEDAFHAACAMQAAAKAVQPANGSPMHIRIGFNYGEVIKESNDVFGNAVNIAARVASITRAGQIMTTQEVLNVLPASLQSRMRLIMRAEFKGKREHQDVYQVSWEQEDIEATRCGMPAFRKTPGNNDEMILRHRDRSIWVNNINRSVSLGREGFCDIVVQNAFASRLHTLIELRLGNFYITDQSSNGTYIRFKDGNEVHITRQEILLTGNGSISLGQSLPDNPEEIIEFSISAPQHFE
ncbi:MAG: adenylate/guanylate cyclase domain-containing protein [Gallionella sp.]|nr:adenylate/guanylate cyclase domain-containing protein [Gallionella sp.]